MNRRSALYAILALVVFALALQGSRGIFDPDEGRYVNIAWRMVETGDWWTPRLHPDLPHYSKPPLTYWAIAYCISVFGHSEWAARLPNAAAFIGTVLLVFGLARRLMPGREVLAATVQATALLPFVAMNIVTTDTILALWVTLGVYGFVRARWDPEPRAADRVLLWVGFGLAFLTKGPPGLLALAAIVAFVISRDGFGGLRRIGSVPGLALFALLAFGWYAAQIAAHPDLLRYLIGEEVVARVSNPNFNRNAGISGLLRAYGAVIPVALAPWMPWAIVRWWRTRCPAGNERSTAGGSAELALLVWWLVLPLAVFFLSKSRLPLYLLQLAPPGALLVARALPADALVPRRRRWLLAGWIALLLTLKGLAAVVPIARDGRRLAQELKPALPFPPLELVVVGRKPRYSLAFYLRCEIEEIVLQGQPADTIAYRTQIERLSYELAEAEPGAVFLIPSRYESAFLAELRESGWIDRRIGEVSEFKIYAMPRPDPRAARAEAASAGPPAAP